MNKRRAAAGMVIILILLIVLPCIIMLSGYAKVIDTQYETVEVVIVDSYHRGMYMTPVRAGKVTTYVTHPAVWRIYVMYDGVQYTLSGSDIYNAYVDKIGETAEATLQIDYYDDGTIKRDIISLGDEKKNDS